MVRGADAAGRAATAVAARTTSQSNVWIALVLGVALAVGVGLVLRLVDVGSHGFWSDEVEVIRRASLSMKAILTDTARRAPLDGPGSYLLTHLMMSVSTGEAWLRLQSVAWSIVAIFGIAALAMRLFGAPRIAILGALLLAIAPFDIRYADELRYYTATSALQLWSLFFLVGWIRSGRLVEFVGYLVSTLGMIAMATSYGLLLLIIEAAVILAAVLRASDRPWTRLLAPVVVALLAVPWVLLMAYLRILVANPLSIHEDVRFVWTLDFPVRAVSWLLSNAEPATLHFVLLIGLIAVAILAELAHGRTWSLRLVALALVELAALAAGAYILGTNVAFRRTLLLLPLMLLPAAAGADAIIRSLAYGRSRRLAGRTPFAVGLVIIVVAAVSLGPVISSLSEEKPDYRAVIAAAAADPARPLVVVGPAEAPVYRAVEFYAARYGIDVLDYPRLVAALAKGKAPPRWSPGRPITWLTVTPVDAFGFDENSYNDVSRLQTLAGDAGYPQFWLAAFGGSFREVAVDLCGLREQTEIVSHRTIDSPFPSLRVWRNAAQGGLGVLASTTPADCD
jgi:hypothetical protein